MFQLEKEIFGLEKGKFPIRKKKVFQLEKGTYFQSDLVNWEMAEEI